ncbi:MAG TPA: HAMP domain-containing sensor histidine kinase [Dermatophilaceae bacterium]|nr:HAMP domain-containing sensor histidine kinase [Dermatophilaceae bacterium]
MRLPRGLVARLLIAQLAVVGVAGLALIATAAIVGPQLFTEHLRHTGESSPLVVQHAEEAFASAFAIALAVSLLMALITAGLVSLLVVRRIAASVTDLADAADAIAAGDYAVTVPSGGFGTEMTRLSGAFTRMSRRLATTETTRTGMLADLSHELRTPLATLEAYIDGMEDHVVPAEPASYAVMRDQVGRLRRLAIDVREASALEEHALALHLETVDPGDQVRTAVQFALPSYQAKGVELTHASDGPVPPIRVDPARIQQVLGNLLANALRHTPPGGHVAVSTSAVGSVVQIAVADDGEGIPTDQLDDVFTRFHRIDPSRASHDGSGSGLGLTIARGLIAGHGGTLTAASDGPGTGSTFTIKLRAEVT